MIALEESQQFLSRGDERTWEIVALNRGRKKIEWVTSKIFVKQLGTHLAKELLMSDRHGGNLDEFPYHLRIREFPIVHKN